MQSRPIAEIRLVDEETSKFRWGREESFHERVPTLAAGSGHPILERIARDLFQPGECQRIQIREIAQTSPSPQSSPPGALSIHRRDIGRADSSISYCSSSPWRISSLSENDPVPSLEKMIRCEAGGFRRYKRRSTSTTPSVRPFSVHSSLISFRNFANEGALRISVHSFDLLMCLFTS
eukprot:751347-Hanusia_phi.AAC.12